MNSRLTVRGFLILTVLSALVLAACAQSAESFDEEATKTRIIEYFQTFFPQLSDVQVVGIEPTEDSPFLKVSVSFTNRGREQTQPVYLTPDGKHLVLGQVWDLTRDPGQVRWEQKKEGADERLAKLDLHNRPFKGNPDAKVTVVEFSDYQCPYCSRAYATLENQLVESYGDRVKFVFKHLPLEQLHPWAKKASIAAACAHQQSQDGFWGFHKAFFENQRAITVENLRDKVQEFGGSLELQIDPLLACFDNDASSTLVEADMHDATELGITSTPTFLINGALVAGAIPFEEMAGYVDQALKDAEGEVQ